MRLFVPLLFLLPTWCAVRAEADEASVRIVADGADATRITASYALPATVDRELRDGPLEEKVGRLRLTIGLVDAKTGESGPAIFGSYSLAARTLSFRPAFGLVRGATYRAAAFNGALDRPVATVDYVVPAASAAAEPTVVRSITPSGESLPANVLRFYVTFSRPMREGREVLERIRLFDEAGNEIRSPWRDLELWNADATRLSLFLHPGRIKQGVNLREQLGPLLEPNRKYVLVIGGDLRDAQGTPLGREVRHAFSTTAEVRSRIDVAAWQVTSPAAGSPHPITVRFDRPLDAALAVRLVRVLDAAGSEVPGTPTLSDGERVWNFTPSAPWRAEKYAVVADPVLEDQVGNTPVRIFDNDLAAPTVQVLPPQLRREFTPR